MGSAAKPLGTAIANHYSWIGRLPEVIQLPRRDLCREVGFGEIVTHLLQARFWMASGWSTISGVIPCGRKRNTQCGQVPRSHEQISGCSHEACRTLFYRRQLVNCVSWLILGSASSATQVYSAAGGGQSSNRLDDAAVRLDKSAHRFFFAVQLTGGRPILVSSCLNAGFPWRLAKPWSSRRFSTHSSCDWMQMVRYLIASRLLPSRASVCATR
jgi:hypothetical protein